MKLFLTTTLAFCLFALTCSAQNTFPTPSGNVGIGTTSPVVKLQVYDAVAGSATNLIRLTNLGTNDGSGTSICMGYNYNLTNPYGIRLVQKGFPSSYRSGTFGIQRHATTVGDTDADWLTSLFIDQSGNIGIGITTPYAGKLNVVMNSTYNNETTGGIAISTGISAQPEIILGADNTNTVSYIQAASRANSFSTVPLSLQPNGGWVGIGTTSPNQKLEVDGTSISGGSTQTNISAYAANGIRMTGIGFPSQDGIMYQSGGGGGAGIAFRRGYSWDTYIDFYTNNTAGTGAITQAMTIDNLGNVGIGSQHPTKSSP